MKSSSTKEDLTMNEHVEDLRERMRLLRKSLAKSSSANLVYHIVKFLECMQREIARQIWTHWNRIKM